MMDDQSIVDQSWMFDVRNHSIDRRWMMDDHSMDETFIDRRWMMDDRSIVDRSWIKDVGMFVMSRCLGCSEIFGDSSDRRLSVILGGSWENRSGGSRIYYIGIYICLYRRILVVLGMFWDVLRGRDFHRGRTGRNILGSHIYFISKMNRFPPGQCDRGAQPFHTRGTIIINIFNYFLFLYYLFNFFTTFLFFLILSSSGLSFEA